MKKSLLDRLLVREVGGYLVFGVALFTTILMAMQELQPLTSMVVEHGVPLTTALEIFFLSVPFWMAFSFPMSMLLSTLLAFGRLSSDSETTALLAAGVSVNRMAVPVAIIGALMSLVAIGFDQEVSPVAMQMKNRLYSMALNSGAPTNRPFQWPKVVDGQTVFLLSADGYDRETKKLLHPTLVYYNGGKPAAVEWADSGTWLGGLNWNLHHGFMQQISDDPMADVRVVRFEDQETHLAVTIDQLLTANEDPNAMTYRQLQQRIDRKIRERRTQVDIDTDEVSLYSKISIPFASLVFALIGFPLGIRRQRSASAIGFALSIAIIFIYYLVYQYSSILGNNGAIPPLVSAWIPDVLGLVVGLTLLKRVMF